MSILFDKPVALSIGPQKCGVKRLEQYFRERGDVCLPIDVSETFFFDRHYQRGVDFYLDYFKPQEDQMLIMELTTTAFDAFEAPEHVRELLGSDVTLFCPLRHPVYRSYDVYQEYLAYGIVSGDIESAVEQAPQILHSSRYAEHLERWFSSFSQETIKIVFYEDQQRDEENYVRDLCAYLSLPYIEISTVLDKSPPQNRENLPGFIKEFVKGFQLAKEEIVRSPLKDPKVIDWLFDRMEDDIAKCEILLGQSFPSMGM